MCKYHYIVALINYQFFRATKSHYLSLYPKAEEISKYQIHMFLMLPNMCLKNKDGNIICTTTKINVYDSSFNDPSKTLSSFNYALMFDDTEFRASLSCVIFTLL